MPGVPGADPPKVFMEVASMRVYVGADHAGFEFKQRIVEHLGQEGYEVVDLGTDSTDSVDYPVYAAKVARAVRDDAGTLGVLVCGTGIGMAIAANKVHGVRAAPVDNVEFARMARLHNDANVVAVPGRGFVSLETAYEIVDTFLTTDFEGGRHQGRVDMMDELDF